jgi:cytochrome c556
MLRFVVGAVLLTLGASVVLAQDSAAIKARQDLMKANGAALKEPGAMAKGEAPFDLAKQKGLWPEDSKTGGNTKALPVIWTNMKGYLDRFDALAKAAKAAEASIKDEASFKTEWPKVVGNCGGCHKEFRAAAK